MIDDRYSARIRASYSIADRLVRYRQIIYLISHYSDHIRYIRRISEYICLGIMVPGIFQKFKYLGGYLASSLTQTDRQKLILNHYEFIWRTIRPYILEKISAGTHIVWTGGIEDKSRILLSSSKSSPMEGEWQLRYNFDGATICTLTFVFSNIIQSNIKEHICCIIGGIQGAYDARSAIRRASRENYEIAPATMLILAMKGIAGALGNMTIYGVSSQRQIFRKYAQDRMIASYDQIWKEHGSTLCTDGLYDLSNCIYEKDINNIPISHRSRTKRKRKRKLEITESIRSSTSITMLKF